MGLVKIYGTPLSRTYRVLWMALEAGVDFENIPLDFRKGETQTDAYARINPLRRIPSMQDGDLVLWESIAINLYLARKYSSDLMPSDAEDEARAIQWSIWGLTEAEPHVVNILQNRVMLPEAERDEGAAQSSEEALKRPMKVIDDALSGRDWLLGDRITVADINLASILSTTRRLGIDLSPWPKADAWLSRCLNRPAAVEAHKLREAATEAAA